jgi:hypothetical protein
LRNQIEALSDQSVLRLQKWLVTYQVDHVLHPLLHADGSQVDRFEKGLLIPQGRECLSATERTRRGFLSLFVDHVLDCLKNRIGGFLQVDEIFRNIMEMHKVKVEVAGFRRGDGMLSGRHG